MLSGDLFAFRSCLSACSEKEIEELTRGVLEQTPPQGASFIKKNTRRFRENWEPASSKCEQGTKAVLSSAHNHDLGARGAGPIKMQQAIRHSHWLVNFLLHFD